MANHKSAAKRARQSEKRRVHNKVKMTKARTLIKKVRAAIAEKDKKTALEVLTMVQSELHRLAKTGLLKLETAGRKTSRLAKQVAQL